MDDDTTTDPFVGRSPGARFTLEQEGALVRDMGATSLSAVAKRRGISKSVLVKLRERHRRAQEGGAAAPGTLIHDARQADIEDAIAAAQDQDPAPAGDNRLADLAEGIRQRDHIIRQRTRLSLQDAIDAGHALAEAKDLLGHGHFLPWVRDVVGMPARTAQRYLAVAQRAEENPKYAVAHLTADALLRAALTPDGQDDEGQDEGADSVGAGDEGAEGDDRRHGDDDAGVAGADDAGADDDQDDQEGDREEQDDQDDGGRDDDDQPPAPPAPPPPRPAPPQGTTPQAEAERFIRALLDHENTTRSAVLSVARALPQPDRNALTQRFEALRIALWRVR